MAVNQVYYSIDKEPGICARYIAQALKAQKEAGVTPRDKGPGVPSTEEIQAAAEMFNQAWEKLTAQFFGGGLG